MAVTHSIPKVPLNSSSHRPEVPLKWSIGGENRENYLWAAYVLKEMWKKKFKLHTIRMTELYFCVFYSEKRAVKLNVYVSQSNNLKILTVDMFVLIEASYI
jgi:hypothetical protein